MAKNIEAEKFLRIFIIGFSIFVFANLLIALQTYLVSHHKLAMKYLFYTVYITEYPTFSPHVPLRATGVFSTPLALGCLSVFGFFVSFALRKKISSILFYSLVAANLINLVLSIAKGAVLVWLMLSFIYITLFLFKRSKILLGGFMLVSAAVAYVMVPHVLPILTHSASFSYKPQAWLTFWTVAFEKPYVFLIGNTETTRALFGSYIHGKFYYFNSVESWIFHMLGFYGLLYLITMLVVWFRPLTLKNHAEIDVGFLRYAYIGLFLASLMSNGGAQPPTSFFIFALSGYLWNVYENRTHEMNKKIAFSH